MVSAIILAAGQSKRMGQPKMLLPWGASTVIQSVISAFQDAGVSDILVVTGADRDALEKIIGKSARTIYNQDYEHGEMLGSIQVGLLSQQSNIAAALIGLGDQPQTKVETIRRLLHTFSQSGSSLIVPSFQNHRGHPWLIARAHWDEVFRMGTSESMRQFLDRHSRQIQYVEAEDSSILTDMDTPEDYRKYRPGVS